MTSFHQMNTMNGVSDEYQELFEVLTRSHAAQEAAYAIMAGLGLYQEMGPFMTTYEFSRALKSPTPLSESPIPAYFSSPAMTTPEFRSQFPEKIPFRRLSPPIMTPPRLKSSSPENVQPGRYMSSLIMNPIPMSPQQDIPRLDASTRDSDAPSITQPDMNRRTPENLIPLHDNLSRISRVHQAQELSTGNPTPIPRLKRRTCRYCRKIFDSKRKHDLQLGDCILKRNRYRRRRGWSQWPTNPDWHHRW